MSSLAIALAAVLAADGLAAYQLAVRSRRPPSFRRGGAFGGDRPRREEGPSAGGDVAVSGGPGAPAVTNAPAAPVPAGVTARPTAYAPGAPTPQEAAGPAAVAGPTPALGTYTYLVQGTESATGFGSRAFPDRMTLTAHRAGADARQVTLDYAFSNDHTEREVVGFRDDAVAFEFEGGQVRFGPMAQTNQADYRPPLVQVPLPLGAGVTRTGSSQAVDAGGAAQRTEDWTVKVVGEETIAIAGVPTATWRVDVERHARPGSSQHVDRLRTYWYDPGRRLWVRITEQMHGQQHYGGVTFTYDDRYTATLTGFAPAG